MTLSKTLMATAAVLVLGAGAAAAEGYTSGSADVTTDTQTQYNSGTATPDSAVPATPDTSAGTNSNVEANANATAAADIRDVQESLSNAGHSISVDGVMGPRTIAALREFQQQNGLPVTGTLNSATLAALDIR